MKHAIYLLLAFTLAIAPAGCSRDRTDDSVSANTDDTIQQDLNPRNPAPAPAAAPKAKPRPSTNRETTASRDRVETEAEREAREDRELDRELDRQAAANRDPEPAPVRTAGTVTLPAGTPVTVTMIDSVSTDGNAEGDAFTASLSEAIVMNGRVLAEKGSKVQGRVQNIEEPGKVKGRASLELVLTKITAGGKTFNLNTEPFVAMAEDNKDRDAGIIAGGAGVGAVIGGIAGGKKGAAIGAIIGGGSGTGAVLATRGQDMRIESETRVRFVTQDDIRLPVIRTTS